MSREEQLSKERDQPESRQEAARSLGHAESKDAETGADRRRPAEVQSDTELPKASGGDPLTRESD
jgi:hypothetical protein